LLEPGSSIHQISPAKPMIPWIARYISRTQTVRKVIWFSIVSSGKKWGAGGKEVGLPRQLQTPAWPTVCLKGRSALRRPLPLRARWLAVAT